MKSRIFFDMDNTLADFSITNEMDYALEHMMKPGYFAGLKLINPATNDILGLLQRQGFEVFILSACVPSATCKQEKREWIVKNIPCIADDHVILVDIGANKADAIGDISRFDTLVDDYGCNLKEWHEKGGKSVKFLIPTSANKTRLCPSVSNIEYLLLDN